MINLGIIIALILALETARGFFRGLSKTLVSMISLLVVIIGSIVLTPTVSRFLSESTEVREYFTEQTQTVVDTYVNAAAQGTLQQDAAEAGNQPANVTQVLSVVIASAITNGDTQDVITQKIVSFAITLVASLITFVVASVIISILSFIISRMFQGKTMRSVDRILGLIFGAFRALLIIWIGFSLISLFSNTPAGSSLLLQIRQNPYLLYIYEANPIAKILPSLLGGIALQL